MFYMRFLPVFMFISITASNVVAQTAKEIIEKAENKLRGVRSLQSDMTIKVVRPNWTREMQLKSWGKGNDLSLIIITAPAKEAGMAFLKRGREIWNWMPAVDRSIKMPPSMMSQPWMGTDFTNDDLVRESSIVRDYEHKIVGDSSISGRSAYKIQLTPKPDAAVIWGKLIMFIDKQEYIQLRGEMYDEEGYLVNIMNSYDIKEMDGRLIATRTELVPVEKEGHKTVMIMNSVQFDKPIEDGFFTIRNMKTLSAEYR